MGCDIHCYLEYKIKGDDRWRSFGGCINPERSYVAFAVLANVRNSFSDIPGGSLPVPIAPRGFPDDVGWDADSDNWLYVSDEFPSEEGSTSRESADKWVKDGMSVYKKGETRWVSNPDWHTHSWLTPAEMRQALELLTDVLGYKFLEREWHIDWAVMLAAADAFTQFGEARIVFWFDN